VLGGMYPSWSKREFLALSLATVLVMLMVILGEHIKGCLSG